MNTGVIDHAHLSGNQSGVDETTMKNLSQYILSHRQRPVPSFSDMEAFLKLSEEAATQARLDELDQQFYADLDQLYTVRAQVYNEDAVDRYIAYDKVLEAGLDDKAWRDLVHTSGEASQREFESTFNYIKSTYEDSRAELLPIIRHYPSLNARFPQSVREFESKTAQMQMRIALFLTGGSEKKERLLKDYGWTETETAAMTEAYSSDEQFRITINGLIIGS